MHELLGSDETVRLAQVFVLILLRLIPIVTWSPLFGGLETSPLFRMGLSLTLAGLFTVPLAAGVPTKLPADAVLALSAKELMVGVTLAVLLRLVFEMLAATGALFDLARGATIANVLDPISGQQRSLLSVGFTLALTTLFLTAGGQRILLDAVGSSFVALPPARFAPELTGRGAAFDALSMFAELFETAVRLATPVIAILLVADVALGLMNRAAPRIQVFFLGLTIKGTLGIGVLFLVAPLLLSSLSEEASLWVLRLFRF